MLIVSQREAKKNWGVKKYNTVMLKICQPFELGRPIADVTRIATVS
jgi:hypothetical protein